jgi:diketogulonate reductase-like aldo/keto reductase
MKITDIKGTVKLNNGVEMPYLGLGVFEAVDGNETIQAIHWALEAGYRHIDTATLYMNEKSVGDAVKSSGINRENIFITTKVWNSDQGYQKTLDAFQASLDLLQTDFIDLYLIHWPVRDKYMETWKALEEVYSQKKARAIGVSNFNAHHIDDIIKLGGTIPSVNQMEFHPYLVQQKLINYCRDRNIQYEAWSPILKGRVNDFPVLKKIGQKYGKTPVQVVLRWDLQKGVVTIPKSVHRDRIISNAEIFDFELTEEDIKSIDALDRSNRIGADPENFNF